jgi:hypothetical protein
MWVTIAVASIPALGALLVVAISEWRQSKRFIDQRDADERARTADRELERERWADARDAERQKQLLTERLHMYAELLTAIEEVARAGTELAHSTLSPRPPAPREMLDRSSKAHGARIPTPPEPDRWVTAKADLERMGTRALLLTSEKQRNQVVEVVTYCSQTGDPRDTPDDWITQEAVVGSGPVVSQVRRCRNVVEVIARRELGLLEVRPFPGATARS